MSLLKKIKESFGQGKTRKEQTERLKEILQTAISDGQITDQELHYLNSYQSDSLVSYEDFQEIKNEAFEHLVNWVMSDRRVNDTEFAVVQNIGAKLNISPSFIETANRRMRYFRLFDHIEKGRELPTSQVSGVVLQKNEICHLNFPASLIEEKVIRSQYRGSSKGVSFRIMKGVTYRVGAQRGRMVSEKDFVPVSIGNFIVTNQRLIFSGNLKSASVPYQKILDLQLFSDAFQFSATNRQKPYIVKLNNSEEIELCGLVISRIIND